MSEQRTTPNRRIAQALWWAAAAIIVCLVAVLVWGGLYAWRRARALHELNAEEMGHVEIRQPAYVPAWLRPRLPIWTYEIHEVHGHSRSRWQALAAFPEVRRVYFWESGLTDADLRSLQNMQHLDFLYLGEEPGITDVGIAKLEGLPYLSELLIHGVRLSDVGLQSISRIPNLEHLSVERTRVTGSGLATLQEARRLRVLEIEIGIGPAITLEALENLESLEELDLGGSGVTPQALRHLRLPPRLKVLALAGPELNDALVDDIPEILAAVPGIERVESLHFGGGLISNFTLEQIGERLGMVEKSGTFQRRSP